MIRASFLSVAILLFLPMLVAAQRPTLGVTVEGKDVGVTVTAVREATPASRARLRSGDVFVAFAGTPIVTIDDLAAALAGRNPNGAAACVVLRANELHGIRVPFGDAEPSMLPASLALDATLAAAMALMDAGRTDLARARVAAAREFSERIARQRKISAGRARLISEGATFLSRLFPAPPVPPREEHRRRITAILGAMTGWIVDGGVEEETERLVRTALRFTGRDTAAVSTDDAEREGRAAPAPAEPRDAGGSAPVLESVDPLIITGPIQIRGNAETRRRVRALAGSSDIVRCDACKGKPVPCSMCLARLLKQLDERKTADRKAANERKAGGHGRR